MRADLRVTEVKLLADSIPIVLELIRNDTSFLLSHILNSKRRQFGQNCHPL